MVSERVIAQTKYMQARRRCVLWGYRAELENLRSSRTVTNFMFSRTVLEKLTETGESPLGEKHKTVIQFLSRPEHVKFRLNSGRP